MTRLFSGLVAATFAVGILAGAAGTIVIREAATPKVDVAAVMADHMGRAASMMGGGMMSGSMMGGGPGMLSGPAASFMPGGLHDQHHPAASPDGVK